MIWYLFVVVRLFYFRFVLQGLRHWLCYGPHDIVLISVDITLQLFFVFHVIIVT